MHLTDARFQNLLTSIYDAPMTPDGWEKLFEQMRSAFHGSSACFGDPQGQGEGAGAGRGQPWLYPQDMLAARNAAAVDDEDRRVLAALAPHFQRAAELSARIAQLTMERDSIAEAVGRLRQGVILADGDGRVLFANPRAEEILADGDTLRRSQGKLACLSSRLSAQLRLLIGEAARPAGKNQGVGGGMLVERDDGRKPLHILVMPVRRSFGALPKQPAAMLFLSDKERMERPPRDYLRQIYGLTEAEAAVCNEILQGYGLQAAADNLGVSPSTARTHLQRIFRKTGTSRQAELVNLLLDGYSVRLLDS